MAQLEFPPNRPDPRYSPVEGHSKHDRKKVVLTHLRGKGFLAGYKLCRRSGLAPWCSVRLAIQYGGA